MYVLNFFLWYFWILVRRILNCCLVLLYLFVLNWWYISSLVNSFLNFWVVLLGWRVMCFGLRVDRFFISWYFKGYFFRIFVVVVFKKVWYLEKKECICNWEIFWFFCSFFVMVLIVNLILIFFGGSKLFFFLSFILINFVEEDVVLMIFFLMNFDMVFCMM